MRLLIAIVLTMLSFPISSYAIGNRFSLVCSESYMQRGTMQVGNIELPLTIIVKRSNSTKYQLVADSPAGVLFRAEYNHQGLCENIDISEFLGGKKSEKLVNAIFQLALGFGDCADLGTIRTYLENDLVRSVSTDKIKIWFDDYKIYDTILVPRKLKVEAGSLKISLTLLKFKKLK